jgi:hypothetical protein
MVRKTEEKEIELHEMEFLLGRKKSRPKQKAPKTGTSDLPQTTKSTLTSALTGVTGIFSIFDKNQPTENTVLVKA